jgi:DNA-directed RNA polymerase subunit RPC12/RpoP
MSLSKRIDQNPARSRVLLSGSEWPGSLNQQRCYRCGKVWWPRQPRKPVRCPGCKSPYWDKPRRLRHTVTPPSTSVKKAKLAHSLGQTLTKAVGSKDADHPGDHSDRSLAHALTVLKEMKAAGRTWQEMADRLEREFGTKLEKDQLKALVR